MNKKNEYQDEGLKGNERIEDAGGNTGFTKGSDSGAACTYVDGDPAADERGRTTDRCCGTGSGTGTNEVTDSEDSGR